MLPNGHPMLGHYPLLTPGQVVPRLDAAGLAALLEQLFDHAERNAKAPSDLISRTFTIVIGTNDAFS
jgi:hypothetical protein